MRTRSILISLLLVATASDAAPPAPPGAVGFVGSRSPEQLETLVRLQEVGDAFMSWYAERTFPLDQVFFEPWSERFDYDNLNVALTADEVADVLVPTYIDEVPEDDAWGNALDYRIYGNPRHWPFFAVRSTGLDGAFEGSVYDRGTYLAAEEFRDIVWVQNGFVTWPEP